MKLAAFMHFLPEAVSSMLPTLQQKLLYLTRENGNLVLRFQGAPEKHALVIQDIVFTPKTKLVIFYSPLSGLLYINHDDMFKSKDLWAYRQRTECFGDPIANIYFHTNWDNSLLFSNSPLVTEETPITKVEGNTYIHDWIESQYPENECVIASNTNLRLAAFKDIHLVDAVVALEQQVDLLTRLVKGIIRSEVEPEWAAEFLNKMETHSTNTVRSPEENLQSAAEYKAKVRTAQVDYLAKRKT